MREFARKLRLESTDAERRLWKALRNRRLRGFKFRRQHPMPPYVLDFCCLELKLCLEIDGGGHLSANQVRHDNARTEFLIRHGFHVKRMTNHDVLVDTEHLVDHLWVLVTQRSGMGGAEGLERVV